MIRAASIMSRVSFSVMRPCSLGTISRRAPRIRIWSSFSRANASDVTICSGYPLTAQINDNETPVLPPVYSTTDPPAARRPSASAASIMARAIRSFMLPVGLWLSSLSRTRAPLPGAMVRSASTGVLPMQCRMSGGNPFMQASFHVDTNYVDTYNDRRPEANAQDAADRCPRPGRGVRRLQQPAGGAPHHPVPRSPDGGLRPDDRPARPDGADRRGLR